MRKKRGAFVIPVLLVVLSLLAFSGCGDPAPDADNGDPSPDVFTATLVDEPPALDGEPGDYPGAPFQVAGIQGFMAHDGQSIFLHLQADAGGWLAAGFNRDGGGMDGANMIIGFAREDGSTAVRNDLGRGNTHSEVASDVVEGVFLETDDSVVLEFAYPLQFPDEEFNLESLEPGNVYTLILAFQVSSQDPSQQHSRWGRLDFTLE